MLSKISDRVIGVKHLSENDSMTRLESWEPGPEDASNFALVGQSMLLLSDAPTGEIWVEIPIVLHFVFDSRRIRKQLGDGVACYQFEALAWLKTSFVFLQIRALPPGHVPYTKCH
jgi:hypothetical protein